MNKQLEALIARAKHIVENGGLLARDTSLQLIAALEQAQQYAKQRDAENQDLMLTIGRLRVEREQAQQHENVHYADAAEAEISSLRKRIAELEGEIKFPGVMRCNTCNFSRSHVVVTAEGMRAGESKPERCPNGCGPLWHDTYRRQYNELYDAYKELEASPLAMPEGIHPDTANLVTTFAEALAAKLRKAELKYGYDSDWKKDGWQGQCLAHFHQHIGKGDPLDVAAYCAFMWHHKWPTAASPLAVKLPESIIDQVCLAAAEIHNRGNGVNDDKAQFIIDRIRNYLENGGTVEGE